MGSHPGRTALMEPAEGDDGATVEAEMMGESAGEGGEPPGADFEELGAAEEAGPDAEEVARLTAYWRKVKWGAQRQMLKAANARLIRVDVERPTEHLTLGQIGRRSGWLDYASHVVAGVIERLRGDQLDLALSGWLQYTARRRAAKRRARKGVWWLRRRDLVFLLECWAAATRERRRRRGLVQRTLARVAGRCLTRSFYVWQDVVVESNARTRWVVAARRQVLGKRLVTVWRGLVEYWRVEKLRKVRIGRSVARTIRRQALLVVSSWAGWARRQHRSAVSVGRCTAKRRARSLQWSVGGWCHSARLGGIVRECRRRAAERSLRRALAQLAEHAGQKLGWRRLQMSVVGSWHRRAIRRPCSARVPAAIIGLRGLCLRALAANAQRSAVRRAKLDRARNWYARR
jgi:hypothetical protein